jgi:hypothetical protein
MNTKEKIENAYKFFESFGINIYTVRFFLKRKFAKRNEVVKFSSKKFAHPIFLRGKTSDFAIFDQIFIEKCYAIDFKIMPEVVLDCGAN